MQAARGAAVAAKSPAQRTVRARTGLFAGIAVSVLVLDVVTKLVAVSQLAHRDRVTLVPHALWLTFTRNAGAAFSVGTGATVVFTAVAAGVVVVIVRTARSLRSAGWAVSLGLLLGGALGNLSDRVFRSPGVFRGHVIDWIELPHWPVFNIADSGIVIGGVLAVLLALRGIEMDGSHHRGEGSSAEPGPSDSAASADG
ncbi:MAG TPA: signal peptidase II [Mycobacteriales bacterium]|nr:signal peptidase II [Mycobacteriales bacterium]